MKFTLRAANYTVTPASSQIAFGGVANFDIRGLMYVGNATAKVDIYVAGDPNLPYTSVSGTTVTFATSMTAMGASDVYVIIYDDPQTIQPVSGTVSATQSGAWSVSVLGTVASVQSGAWTVAVSNGFALDATITARLNTLGQKTGANSAPVVIASDQSAVAVSNGGTFAVQNTAATPAGTNSIGTVGLNAGTNSIGSIANITGTVSLPTGAATAANQTAVAGSATGGTAATQSQLGGGVYNSTAPTLTNGQQCSFQFTQAGALIVSGVGASSGSITAAGTNGTSAQAVQGIVNGVPAPTLAVATAAANAVLESRVASAASTNATSLKTSAGNIVGIELYNLATSVRYLKVYNRASAPTVGTDTPTWTIPLPAGGGFSWEPPIPRTFATGLAYAITGGVADSDTTAVAANDVVGIVRYL